MNEFLFVFGSEDYMVCKEVEIVEFDAETFRLKARGYVIACIFHGCAIHVPSVVENRSRLESTPRARRSRPSRTPTCRSTTTSRVMTSMSSLTSRSLVLPEHDHVFNNKKFVTFLFLARYACHAQAPARPPPRPTTVAAYTLARTAAGLARYELSCQLN